MVHDKRVTKKDLIDGMRQRVSSVTRNRASEAIEILLENIKAELTRGQPVQLSGFGTFSVRQLPGKVIRNPRTGDPIEVPPQRTVVFRPSRVLREAMKPAHDINTDGQEASGGERD